MSADISARLDFGPAHSQEFYVLRVDAPPGVEVPGGSYVTVESGPHHGLQQALNALQHPKPRAHTLPDIIFLPLETPVYALNEAVRAKPRMVVTATVVQAARGGDKHMVSTPARRTGGHEGSADRPAPATCAQRSVEAGTPLPPPLGWPPVPGMQLSPGSPLPVGLQWQTLQQVALAPAPAVLHAEAGPSSPRWACLQLATEQQQQQEARHAEHHQQQQREQLPVASSSYQPPEPSSPSAGERVDEAPGEAAGMDAAAAGLETLHIPPVAPALMASQPRQPEPQSADSCERRDLAATEVWDVALPPAS